MYSDWRSCAWEKVKAITFILSFCVSKGAHKFSKNVPECFKTWDMPRPHEIGRVGSNPGARADRTY